MMDEKDIQILGVCRFSMLGRGDWKAYKENLTTSWQLSTNKRLMSFSKCRGWNTGLQPSST